MELCDISNRLKLLVRKSIAVPNYGVMRVFELYARLIAAKQTRKL